LEKQDRWARISATLNPEQFIRTLIYTGAATGKELPFAFRYGLDIYEGKTG